MFFIFLLNYLVNSKECYVTDTIVKSLNMTLSDAHDNSDLDYINSNLDVC